MMIFNEIFTYFPIHHQTQQIYMLYIYNVYEDNQGLYILYSDLRPEFNLN